MSQVDILHPQRLVRDVLRASAITIRSVEDVARAMSTTDPTSRSTHPIARALSVAASAMDLGSAFAAGYWAATETLLTACGAPSNPGERTSLAVTERGGAHPRAIEVTLHREGDLLRLAGQKSFATLADRSTHVLVVAKDARDPEAPPAPHPRLVAVRVPIPHEGLTFSEGMRVPFCPEISHPVLHLATAPSSALERVGNDAFVDVLQRFRTIEDRAVIASALSYLLAWSVRATLALDAQAKLVHLLSDVLLRVARPDDELERLAALGMSALLRQTVAELLPLFESKRDSFDGGASFVMNLSRDVGLLSVAERLRIARASKAFDALTSGST